MTRWTTRDISQLRRMYPHFQRKVVAEKLGRTIASIEKMAGKIGIRKRRNSDDWMKIATDYFGGVK
jgi:hypothetical protein